MTTNHIPGPWFADANFAGPADLPTLIKVNNTVPSMTRDKVQATVRLVAAAPALLAALRSLAAAVDQFVPLSDEWPELDEARAAIALATLEDPLRERLCTPMSIGEASIVASTVR
jgi:hypothetical protein